MARVAHRLDAEALRRFQFVVDLPSPSASDRAELWRRALPSRTPCKTDQVDWEDVGRRFEFGPGQIARAAYRAAAAAALRSGDLAAVNQSDLETAARAEKEKAEGDLNARAQGWFT